MRTAKAGGGLGDTGFGGAGDFGAMAQRYWNAWSDTLRSAAAGAAPGPADAWQSVLDGWTRMAGGARRDDIGDTIERFAGQARQWFGAMQQVAGQFSGRPAGAEDVVRAWKQAMGAGAENPFAGLFSGMAGRGHAGFDQWFEQVSPLFGAAGGAPIFGDLRQEGRNWLRMPAFGMAREHQERWQALASAQLELQQKNDEYNALMLEAGRDAFERFERKLAERSEPGRQLQSARALFDLWIDAAEEAYAEIALSQRFRRLYGELVNAQMRVRAGIQREIEHVCGLFGMPTRTEVDSAHRKIAELERQLRRLHRGAPAEAPGRVAAKAPAHESAPAVPAKPKPAASKPAVSKSAAANKTATKTAAPAPASKPARAAAKPSARRAPKSLAIAMPQPLKPMPLKSMTADQPRQSAKRKR